ncbi:MAG: hypothetical protein WD960_11010 [Gemmatimonadota bacterium]
MTGIELRQVGDELRDGDVRKSCTREEFDALRDPSWRGLPPIVIRRTAVRL